MIAEWCVSGEVRPWGKLGDADVGARTPASLPLLFRLQANAVDGHPVADLELSDGAVK